jgi:Cdc6-like AAA superfamily ATPase
VIGVDTTWNKLAQVVSEAMTKKAAGKNVSSYYVYELYTNLCRYTKVKPIENKTSDSVYKIEKMLELINKVNSMSNSEMELMKKLLNS